MTLAEQLRSRKHALSVNELAEILQLDPNTVRRHIRRGHIPCFKVGGTIRFDPQQVADWLEAMNMLPLSAMRSKKVG
jgi:excisionase family DNA binding protein